MTTAHVTIDLDGMDGQNVPPSLGLVATFTPRQSWWVTDGSRVHVLPVMVPLATDGTGATDLVVGPAWTLTVTTGRGRQQRVLGPVDLPPLVGDTTLADWLGEPVRPVVPPDVVGELRARLAALEAGGVVQPYDDSALVARVDALEARPVGSSSSYVDLGAVSGAVTLPGSEGTVVLDLSGDATLTIDGGSDGAVLAVVVGDTGGHTATLLGQPLTGRAVCQRVRGTWRMALATTGGTATVAPAEPIWDDSTLSATIPSIAGITYSDDANTLTGTVTYAPGTTVTITATAQTGYALAAGVAASWTHTFPAPSAWQLHYEDTCSGTTPPTAGQPVETGTGTWLVLGDSPTVTAAGGAYAVSGATGIGIDSDGIGTAHAIEIDYDATGSPTGAHILLMLSWSWGYHAITFTPDGTGTMTLAGTATSDSAWALTLTEGKSLTGHPTIGTLRGESDGTRITISINGATVASALRSTTANPAWASDPSTCGWRLMGEANVSAPIKVASVRAYRR